MTSPTRHIWTFVLGGLFLLRACPAQGDSGIDRQDRPNIVFAIADDWGWPHASAYGDPVVATPTFDRLAHGGILFENAFVSSPSCTPSRNAILTGQSFWRLGTGANLWSRLDPVHETFPPVLEQSGYFIGRYRKSWGPGKLDNREGHPVGPEFKSVDAFLAAVPEDRPFFFWFGSSDPHRPYTPGAGAQSGMALEMIRLFPHFPDVPLIRSDVADYYWEVQRFDSELAALLIQLEQRGLADNTLVVMTGDHGMPFPRGKGNLYDSGTHVPLAIRWPAAIPPGRRITDFVNLTDLAPTFLSAAGVEPLPEMTGRSLLPILTGSGEGRVSSDREWVVFGKERHVPCQEAPDRGGTPMRAIRSDRFLLIHNLTPDRWPAGTPDWKRATIPGCWLGDVDNGPTKTYMVEQRDRDDEHRWKYELAFGKRPEWELYDLDSDPGQLQNVADQARYASAVAEWKVRLERELKETGDPRSSGGGVEEFEDPPYFGRGPRHPDWKPEK